MMGDSRKSKTQDISKLLQARLRLRDSEDEPVGASAAERSGSSMLEALKRYEAQQESDFLAKQRQAEKLRSSIANVRVQDRFNYRNVPRKIKEHTESLPIYKKRAELIEMVRRNQIVIVEGETGSGKSTQIPQYLVEAGFCDNGKGIIGITQPRRVAAKSLADRVAKEGGVGVGGLVGYAVRFDKKLSGETLVKYMTDGLLVKECTQEPNLQAYSVIIIDEAHERSIHTDVCFGLLKRAAKNRPELKIIISSATLDAPKFSKYFNNAPFFKVEGKMHPVEEIFSDYPVPNTNDQVVSTVLTIHAGKEEGDILVFLSGQDEIEYVWERLEETNKDRSMLIMPCYGALPFEDQQKIFEETPPKFRKIVLATNIAETSLTIEGIVFVVDSGYFKQNQYNPKTKIDTLERKRITRFQAIQRKGRAGRTRPGKCYRLYTRSEYVRFRESPEPDITRCNVESVMLDLMAMGITEPLKFDFMDMPHWEAMMSALQNLQELSALDDKMNLTQLGKKMASFPLDPPLSKVLIESANLGCSSEVIKIVALLSTQHQNIFYRGKKVRKLADAKRAIFNQPEGDYLTLLKIFEAWCVNMQSQKWCRDNYINFRILEEADEIRIQLIDIYQSHRYQLSNSKSDDPLVKLNVRRAFTSGYFRQIARKKARGHAFEALSGTGETREVFLHPTSALFNKNPADPWLIFHETMVTTKAYMRGASVIEPHWIRLYAPKFADKLKSYHYVDI